MLLERESENMRKEIKIKVLLGTLHLIKRLRLLINRSIKGLLPETGNRKPEVLVLTPLGKSFTFSEQQLSHLSSGFPELKSSTVLTLLI